MLPGSDLAGRAITKNTLSFLTQAIFLLSPPLPSLSLPPPSLSPPLLSLPSLLSLSFPLSSPIPPSSLPPHCRANLKLVRERNDYTAMGRTVGNLGNTYYLLGNYKKAIKYHEEVSVTSCMSWVLWVPSQYELWAILSNGYTSNCVANKSIVINSCSNYYICGFVKPYIILCVGIG